MIHKRPAVFLPSCNAFCSLHSSQSPASPFFSRSTEWPLRPQQKWQSYPSYATVASGGPDDGRGDKVKNEIGDDEPHWPNTDPSRLPTPYQILNCRPGAAYSKHHFYRLVKLYHPDRNGHEQAHIPSAIHTIPHHIRLERYRLIVTAHTILSDPTRRRLYDQFGSGWAGRPEKSSVRFHMDREPPNWPPGQNPMYNATWEDWETWYQQQRDREKDETARANGEPRNPPQRTLLMNNYAFVSLIVMLAALGGVGQATRAQQYGVNYQEQRKEANDRTHADLMTVRGHASSSSKEEKVKRFLQARDGAAYADEGTRRMLLEPDICESARMEDGRGSYGTVSRRAG